MKKSFLKIKNKIKKIRGRDVLRRQIPTWGSSLVQFTCFSWVAKDRLVALGSLIWKATMCERERERERDIKIFLLNK